MKKVYLLLVVLLVSLFLFGCGRSVEPVARETLKVMTLNIWSGLDYQGTWTVGRYETSDVFKARYQALLEEIRMRNPDVIGMNEVNTTGGFLRRLKKDLSDYDIIFHVGVSGLKLGTVGLPWNLREGDAILAKKDLQLDSEKRIQLSDDGFVKNWVSFHTGDATQVLLSTIIVNGEQWYLAATHLHASVPDNDVYSEIINQYSMEPGYPDEDVQEAFFQIREDQRWRNREFDKLDQFLKKEVPEGAKLVIMGDFNADENWPEIKKFRQNGYGDTYRHVNDDPGFTWNPVTNSNIKAFYISELDSGRDSLITHLNDYFAAETLRLDYIFTGSQSLLDMVIRSEVCAKASGSGVTPSDHYGVITEFNLD